MLKAGFARLDITPPLGTPISGYFYERKADGILDPLELNALAVSDDESTAVIIVSDLIGIKISKATNMRNMISEKLGIPASNIILVALHQHTSYVLRENLDHKVGEYDIIKDEAFMSVVTKKFCDAAELAVRDMSDAQVETAIGETEVQISFIRRFYVKEGPVVTNPSRLDPNLVGYAGTPDNSVRLVRFKRTGKKDIALVNFATHPDVITGTKISADWPGFVRRYVEKDNKDVYCILLNGFQGDTNHVNRFVAKQWDNTYDFSAFMGRTIADVVTKIWDSTTPHKADKIFSDVKVIYTKTNTEGEERYEECKAFYDAYEAHTLGRTAHITEIAAARKILRLRDETIYRTVPVSVMGIGDIAIVGFGGEPFTAYADNIRSYAVDKFVLTACCTNAYEGYLPSAAAFSEGGYESSGSLFCPSIEKECTDAAKELLNKF